MMNADFVRAVVETVERGITPKPIIQADFKAVALPDRTTIVDLERFNEKRNRFRGTYKTNSVADFAEYHLVRRRAAAYEPQTYVDADSLKATTFFNIEALGHCDDIAVLTLKQSHAYQALLSLDGKRFTQRGLVDWVEDWLPNLTIYREGTVLGNAQAIAAIRTIEINATSKMESQVSDVGARRSSLEQIEASAKGGLPTSLLMELTPAEGLSQITAEIRIQCFEDGGKPAFALRVKSIDTLKELVAEDFVAKVRYKIGEFAMIYRGTFTP